MPYHCGKPLYIETPLWWSRVGKAVEPDLSVPGPKEVDTGLVTATGSPIYRTQPPIGFGRDSDW
jgi:hypothetical protein